MIVDAVRRTVDVAGGKADIDGCAWVFIIPPHPISPSLIFFIDFFSSLCYNRFAGLL